MSREPLPIAERTVEGDTGALRLPAALAADIEGNLAVADTGHHRVLYGQMVGNSFAVRRTVGIGEPGFVDGPFEEAAFDEPHGLALLGDMMIVSDRGNHAIRMVDLANGRVATMAGTGEMAPGPIVPGPALETALRDPWDVWTHDYGVFVAMAGTRQIWRLDLQDGEMTLHAEVGSGGANDVRPMTLASDEERLYVADAGTSIVGRASFDDDAGLETLVGPAGSGTGDAGGADSRLRHLGGIAWGHGNHRLWIADAGSDELLLLDPEAGRVERLDPFDETLSGPMGLASAGHLLYVTDTNRHRILRVDQVDKRVVTLGVEP